MNNFTREEIKIIKKLNTPERIQSFIDKIPINFEEDGETCYSPRRVLQENKCHCIEGALFAVFCLNYHGKKAYLVDLKTGKNDWEHVVCAFKKDKKWGAISKTNHAVLRYREPVYNSVRELVMSYFHEYTNEKGDKTLRSFSIPVDLSVFDNKNWISDKEDLWYIHDFLDSVEHFDIMNKEQIKNLRKADKIEIEAGKLVEWKK